MSFVFPLAILSRAGFGELGAAFRLMRLGLCVLTHWDLTGTLIRDHPRLLNYLMN